MVIGVHRQLRFSSVLRCDGLTPQQKGLQIALSWLIPLVGGMAIVGFHWSELRPASARSGWLTNNDSSQGY